MFRRRRPFRRPGRGPLQRLEKAQRLFEEGQFDEAAHIFQRLAAGAVQRGMLDRGSDLFARAAQCHLELGHVEQAIALGKRSLRLLGRAGQMGKVQARWPKMVEALAQKGYHDEATALREEIEAFLDGRPLAGPRPGLRGRRPEHLAPSGPAQLPASCPHCGGPVNLNEVTWAGPDRAECAYCSGIITAKVR
jgi:tetratricopeptide (TPR) repeat protein